jgi:hypothetical protein
LTLLGNTIKLGVVAHACNPAYSGGKELEDLGSRPAQAKSSQDPSQPMAGVVACVTVIPAMWRNISRKITVQASPGIKQGPLSKITKAKLVTVAHTCSPNYYEGRDWPRPA